MYVVKFKKVSYFKILVLICVTKYSIPIPVLRCMIVYFKKFNFDVF